MKFSKKYLLSAGAAVLMTAALATGAFAAESVDTLEGTPAVDGTIAAVSVPCTLADGDMDAEHEALSLAAVEVVDFDRSAMDLTDMLPCTPAADTSAK